MKKKTYKNILWENNYRSVDFFDNSRTLQGKETGNFSGLVIIYRFLILGDYNGKNRFLIEPDYIKFGGGNDEEMAVDFENKTVGMKEWDTKGENYKHCDIFPEEVVVKLKEFNLNKYVKYVK